MTRQTRLTHALRAALLVAALIVGSAGLASAQTTAELGKPAPAFELKDVNGKAVKLADFRGKTVVLEWFNPGCPFVKYAHGEGPLKEAAKRPGAGRADVVWLAINSSASGKQGHGVELNKQAGTEWKMTYPLLIDESGSVGRLYGAKTTPHMYVIDASGKLVYRGALDNAPLGRSSDGKTVSYVQAALDDLAAGRAVRTPETQSYGCSVKY
jgi:alkyl hydroperoxide reductase subunit AhpC